MLDRRRHVGRKRCADLSRCADRPLGAVRSGPARLEDGFRADPALVWRWYAWRREAVAQAEPNAGHRALALAAGRYEHFSIVTQNVDGLHRRAGSLNVIEIHGSIARTICLARCGYAEDDPARVPAGEPPHCPRCGDWLRPGVVWFGEMLDAERCVRPRLRPGECELMLVVGTSGLVHPAAGLPRIARRCRGEGGRRQSGRKRPRRRRRHRCPRDGRGDAAAPVRALSSACALPRDSARIASFSSP